MPYPTMNIIATATLPNISLAEQIRSLLNDPSPGFVMSDTQILNCIKRAANIMAKEGKCYELETASVALGTATSEYKYVTCGLSTAANVIDYVVDIEAVIYGGANAAAIDTPAITAQALFKISQQKLAHLDQNTSGPPRYWCDTGKSIRVWPVPSASENLFICTIFYYKNTNHLKADDDTSATYYVPNHMREYVIWYTLGEAYKRKGRPDIAQWYRSLFDKFVMYHRQDRLNKYVASHEEMKLADNTQYT